MTPEPTPTLRELGSSNAAARVFERYHLESCCGGWQSQAATCAASGNDLQQVITELDQALGTPGPARNPEDDSLGELIQLIVATHHAFTRTELPRIANLLRTVILRHAEAHPELRLVGSCFNALHSDLGPHLLKEEQILFPYIRGLERYRHGGLPSPPVACFGILDHPIRQMEAEHQTVGDLLKEIRRLTGDFAVPADGCPTYCNTYQALEGLETDLMRHIHLENSVLFPRAQKLAGVTG